MTDDDVRAELLREIAELRSYTVGIVLELSRSLDAEIAARKAADEHLDQVMARGG